MIKRKASIGRVVVFGVLGVVAACLLAAGALWVSNRNLPTESSMVDRLSGADKARLAETTHLRQALGEHVWPGWGEMDIPLIVYNEGYAFLVGYADPPPGWIREPGQTLRGGAWEEVPGDTFNGEAYYRQELPDPEVTPENFTVRVGERWAATLQTKEYAFIRFVDGFGGELPPVVRDVFPYRLMWGPLGGQSESWMAGLVHEAFHSLQGAQAYDHFAEAESAVALESEYPWEDEALKAAWQEELEILASVAEVESEAEARELAGQFLQRRDERRTMAGMTDALVDFERQREWLEGLAKYAELEITRLAAVEGDYTPLAGMAEDADFNQYAGRERFYRQQFQELNRMTNREGEIRFYYTGMAQAALLDWLRPDWKSEGMEAGFAQEDELRKAIGEG